MRNIGAVILAAGESSRFGQSKQLIQFRGKSLVRRIVDAASEADCAPIIVVAGNDRDKIENELKQSGTTIAANENWRGGIGTSIRTGVQHLIDNAPNIETIVLLVCDQPFVDSSVIKKLIALRETTNKAIVASSYAETLGVPTLFGRSCFAELLALDDETGAKPIIFANLERVAEFAFLEGRVDIDSAEDFEKCCASIRKAFAFKLENSTLSLSLAFASSVAAWESVSCLIWLVSQW
jgi:molybdenum cofactor cytidylyltransferase